MYLHISLHRRYPPIHGATIELMAQAYHIRGEPGILEIWRSIRIVERGRGMSAETIM
jgi:hypothetical protein